MLVNKCGERNHKQQTVETVQNTAVARQNCSIIFDTGDPFYRRKRQITQLRNAGGKQYMQLYSFKILYISSTTFYYSELESLNIP